MRSLTSQIIFLNGTSSAGKTTLAHHLLSELGSGWLHVALDTFIDMQSPTDRNSADYRVFERLVAGFHASIVALAATGNNLVVDHVLLEPTWHVEIAGLLVRYPVTFVAVEAPLEVLEQRERSRDVRRQGFVRAQWPWVHAGKAYDLRLDTSMGASKDHLTAVLAVPPNLRSRLFEIPPRPAVLAAAAARGATPPE